MNNKSVDEELGVGGIAAAVVVGLASWTAMLLLAGFVVAKLWGWFVVSLGAP